MTEDNSAIASPTIAVPRAGPASPAPRRPTSGLLLAALGVTCFSLTFPATAWTLEGFGPWSATTLRIVLAALLACALIAVLRVPVPARRHWPWLAVSASGVMIGFP